MENTYQGYRNRSTWLAVLHLNNTTKEIHEEAQKLAKLDDVTPLSVLLWEKTKCEQEEGYRRSDVDWVEVITALED